MEISKPTGLTNTMNNNKSARLRIIGILAVVVIVALTIYAYSMREQIVALRRYGYIGIWLIEFIANASVLLPIPGSLVTAAMIPLLHSPLLAIISSNAAAVGELTAYMAGLGGSIVVENQRWYDRVKKWITKFGGVTIMVLAAIPNPLFDTAGLVAGAARMNMVQFFLWCWLGKFINRTILVFGGAALFEWFKFLIG
ncbi:MAG: VTT domain-containing protein [Anaerolineales bacterium]